MTSETRLETPLTTACRWETPTRYYVGQVQENLFGQWELIRAWGGRGNRLGGMMVEPAASQGHALQLLAAEDKRRRRRGYTFVAGDLQAGRPQSAAEA